MGAGGRWRRGRGKGGLSGKGEAGEAWGAGRERDNEELGCAGLSYELRHNDQHTGFQSSCVSAVP